MVSIRRLLVPLFTLAMLGLTFTPVASAAALGCAFLAPAPQVPAGLPVPAAYPNTLTTPCGGGLDFTSATAACPLTLAPVVLPGEYCGAIPGFASGATVICTGIATNQSKFGAIVVGLDQFPWDGNILPPEPLVYEGVYSAPVHSAKIFNNHTLPARVIAYPVDVIGPGPILVNCV